MVGSPTSAASKVRSLLAMDVKRLCIGMGLVALPMITAGCQFDESVSSGLSDSNDGGPSVTRRDSGSQRADAGASVDAGPMDAQPPACLMDPTYVERDGSDHRYRFEGSGLHYDQAQASCAATGGHLVVIDDEDENVFVASLGGAPWIGLNDLAVENSFSWVTGVVPSYSNWSNGEPNDSGDHEDCALTTGGNWNDGECSNLREFVCECDPARVAPPPPTCMMSPAYSQIHQGRRYRSEAAATNYMAAQTSCNAEGGHLVVVTDDTENDYVRNMISENAWIGYSDTDVEGSFVWATGTANLFIHWGGGQPDNSGDEDCVETNTNGDWNDLPCSRDRDFVCECDPVVVTDSFGGI